MKKKVIKYFLVIFNMLFFNVVNSQINYFSVDDEEISNEIQSLILKNKEISLNDTISYTYLLKMSCDSSGSIIEVIRHEEPRDNCKNNCSLYKELENYFTKRFDAVENNINGKVILEFDLLILIMPNAYVKFDVGPTNKINFGEDQKD